ncbi:MAG: hypothetical protein KBC64_00545 [Simkaniaceae bacterium]|nr:hypothetical protein [Simkaniaceae bacterium]
MNINPIGNANNFNPASPDPVTSPLFPDFPIYTGPVSLAIAEQAKATIDTATSAISDILQPLSNTGESPSPSQKAEIFNLVQSITTNELSPKDPYSPMENVIAYFTQVYKGPIPPPMTSSPFQQLNGLIQMVGLLNPINEMPYVTAPPAAPGNPLDDISAGLLAISTDWLTNSGHINYWD